MLADPNLDGARVAYAIGRTAGNAVRRNRVRRQLRELMRGRSLEPGLYLVGLSHPADAVEFDRLRSDLDAVCRVMAGAA
jgi:ribonuclease P protein component